jgi:glyoxylase-like metal-dependent hydrolase (beta-lactamase superfamily II)
MSDNADPTVYGFHEPGTGSVAYVAADERTRKCAIIDPVWDFDRRSGRTSTESADAMLALIRELKLEVSWILDTHPHADHFSAGIYLQEKTGAPRAIGARVVEVQRLWQKLYHLGDDFPPDGSQWDRMFAAGDRFQLGELEAEVIFSPGHTLASVTYLIGNAAFVHDTLFQPDFGTARCDFPGGDAHALWRSIQEILALPDATRLYTGHDYRPGNRQPMWESSVAEQKARNIHLRNCPNEAAFVRMREARDRGLPLPDLMLYALQVNIRGGRLPEPEADGNRYFKIPANRF